MERHSYSAGSKDALASASARLDAGCDAASIAVVGETVAV